jgi:hypothetical protein
MKGPGLRSNFAGSRLWRCPQTGHELHTKPNVTSMPSPFAAGKWMIAVDPPRNYRAVVPIEDFVSIVEAEPAVEVVAVVVEQVVVTEETVVIEETVVTESLEEIAGSHHVEADENETQDDDEGFGEGLT